LANAAATRPSGVAARQQVVDGGAGLGGAHGFLNRLDYQFAINALLLTESFDVLCNTRTH
jgi:hypothetical protein